MDVIFKRKSAKAQGALEYLTIYGFALVVLAIFLAAVYIFISTTYTPITSSCYITPGFRCYEMLISSNAMTSKAVVLFTNNLGVGIQISNGIVMSDPYTNFQYQGSCTPVNAIPGASVVCNVTLTNLKQQPVDTQLNPKFNLNYQICPSKTCDSYVYNTTGTAVVFTSPPVPILITRLISRPAAGKVSINNIQYPNGTYYAFLQGSPYTIYAVPPSNYAFKSWNSGGGVSISNNLSQSTSATVAANGSRLIAVFGPFSTTSTSISATSSSSTTTTTTSVTSTSTSTTTSTTSTSTTTTSPNTVPACNPPYPYLVSCSQSLGYNYGGYCPNQATVAHWQCGDCGNPVCNNVDPGPPCNVGQLVGTWIPPECTCFAPGYTTCSEYPPNCCNSHTAIGICNGDPLLVTWQCN